MMAYMRIYQDVAIMIELKTKILAVLIVLVLASCNQEAKTWQLENTMNLDGISPLGISFIGDDMWIADSDHNRLVRLDEQGKIQEEISDIQRPMHISSSNDHLLIPEFGKDQILHWKNGQLDTIVLEEKLDAPAGVATYNTEMAIADFYNHRILYFDGSTWKSIGEEGKQNGQFYYPTDVQITETQIIVADAYNNRVQTFNKQGEFIAILGEDLGMNAATGIFMKDKEIIVTDFENDRVFILDDEGKMIQEIKELSKPVDAIIHQDKLLILNYKSKEIKQYIKK